MRTSQGDQEADLDPEESLGRKAKRAVQGLEAPQAHEAFKDQGVSLAVTDLLACKGHRVNLAIQVQPASEDAQDRQVLADLLEIQESRANEEQTAIQDQ